MVRGWELAGLAVERLGLACGQSLGVARVEVGEELAPTLRQVDARAQLSGQRA
jgi:hypothetical protein